MSDERALDVVLFGATGFVGRLTADYLARHAPEGVRIGLAGRDERRLAQVRAALGARAGDWPLLVTDAHDADSTARLAGATRVVATTVGPYARYGMPLVAACAQAGTHYADLTGEVLFVRDSIDAHHKTAVDSGARIVHSCGFDSIPSDLGVLVVHEAVTRDGAGELEDTTCVVTAMKGGVSGGTLASMRTQFEDVAGRPDRRRVVMDPYALSPDRADEPALGPERDLLTVTRDRDLGRWTAPFVMAGYNTRIVRRTNAVQGWPYGRRFRYREVTGFDPTPVGLVKAAAVSAGLLTTLGVMSLRPTRDAAARVLPKPGQGPSQRRRETGLFRMEIHARTSTGAHYVGRVAAQGDPGYAATSVMLGESALSLALDGERLPARAGVLTPAAAIGLPLVDRLRVAGFTFDAGPA